MKSFKSTAWLLPQPVLIIGTYDKEGKLKHKCCKDCGRRDYCSDPIK
ncbi:hypothetical protein [Xylanibacter ruminicola]|nr:hypothetical protein [Xylanibacter ruminicola]SEH97974.1 hypothetical protein SAMN02745192_2641 [Xylanibacter ruminicola]